jgi:hypothetical protein
VPIHFFDCSAVLDPDASCLLHPLAIFRGHLPSKCDDARDELSRAAYVGAREAGISLGFNDRQAADEYVVAPSNRAKKAFRSEAAGTASGPPPHLWTLFRNAPWPYSRQVGALAISTAHNTNEKGGTPDRQKRTE